MKDCIKNYLFQKKGESYSARQLRDVNMPFLFHLHRMKNKNVQLETKSGILILLVT